MSYQLDEDLRNAFVVTVDVLMIKKSEEMVFDTITKIHSQHAHLSKVKTCDLQITIQEAKKLLIIFFKCKKLILLSPEHILYKHVSSRFLLPSGDNVRLRGYERRALERERDKCTRRQDYLEIAIVLVLWF